MESYDFLLNGVFADEVVDGDGLILTYTVSTVGGLLLDGGVPPWVEMEDIVRPCEIEAEASSLETDEEDRLFTILEGGYHLCALLDRHTAIDVEVVHMTLVQLTLDDIEEADELAEYKSPVASFDDTLQEFGESGYL